MKINIEMSKEEFLDYTKFTDFKSNLNCGIINLETSYNKLLKQLLDDGIWKDKNKYGKIIDEINADIDALKVVDSR